MFIADARESDATQFLLHSAIMSRVYHFEFRPCALSVLHFVRFDLDAELIEADEKKTNVTHFSASVGLLKPIRNPTYEKLLEALSALSTHADEFFEEHTSAFVMTAYRFCAKLSDFGPCSVFDIKSIAFWKSVWCVSPRHRSRCRDWRDDTT